MSYLITFTVEADTTLAAIAKASGMVRTGVKVNGVSRTTDLANGWFEVVLSVWEDA